METNVDTEYGDDSLETITEDILLGLGCNTLANNDYLYTRLVELVSYVTGLAAEQATKRVLDLRGVETGSIDGNRDTIEL